MKNIILTILAVLVGTVASELYLRLTVARELMFDTWFEPGINIPDRKYGFVFAPNYKGYMRHRDKVPNVPLELDGNGFRIRNSQNKSGLARPVVVIGGMSMMMGYGLPDDRTITGRMATRSRYDLQVQNTAWPGFPLYLNWHVFKDKLGTTGGFKVAVLCIHGETPSHYYWLPKDFAKPPAPPREDVFRFVPGLAIKPEGRLQAALGRNYYRSFVMFKVFRVADRLLDEWAGPSGRERAQAGESEQSGAEVREAGLRRFSAFMTYINGYFRRKGTIIIVAFLPTRGAPRGYYGELAGAIQSEIPWIDLHAELYGKLGDEGLIAGGHYGAEQSDLIAARLISQVDGLLSARE